MSAMNLVRTATRAAVTSRAGSNSSQGDTALYMAWRCRPLHLRGGGVRLGRLAAALEPWGWVHGR